MQHSYQYRGLVLLLTLIQKEYGSHAVNLFVFHSINSILEIDNGYSIISKYFLFVDDEPHVIIQSSFSWINANSEEFPSTNWSNIYHISLKIKFEDYLYGYEYQFEQNLFFEIPYEKIIKDQHPSILVLNAVKKIHNTFLEKLNL